MCTVRQRHTRVSLLHRLEEITGQAKACVEDKTRQRGNELCHFAGLR